MKNLQITVMAQAPAGNDKSIFATQVGGMLTPPPLKVARAPGTRPQDALLAGLLSGLDEVMPRLEEGDCIELRPTGAAADADPSLQARLREKINLLRRKGVDILLTEISEADIPAVLLKQMKARLEMSRMMRM